MSNPVLQRAAIVLRAFILQARASRAVPLLALAVLVGAAACAEQLDSGAACTTLCPLANEQLRDTVLEPVSLDTTLAGFPLTGAERPLLIAVGPGPDSLDVRAVVRFDSLPTRYAPIAGGDSVAITTVDSTYLRLRLDTTSVPTVNTAGQLEAYDVDTPGGTDTTTATLATLFRPDRLIGRVAIPAGVPTTDSLRVPISNAVFAAKARAGARLRIGLRLVSSAQSQLRVLGVRTVGGLSPTAPTLTFHAATDTGYKAALVPPSSKVPAADTLAAAVAIDQSLVVRTPRAPQGTDLVVGGIPGRRALLQFTFPLQLTDSTDVVRAVLELTQRPVRSAPAGDIVRMRSEAVLATTSVTDLVQAALLAAPGGFGADTLSLFPADSGVRQFSLVTLVRAYRALPSNTSRAIALRVPLEGAQASEIRFYSAEAPAGLRPRLRLTYIPRTSFGIP